MIRSFVALLVTVSAFVFAVNAQSPSRKEQDKPGMRELSWDMYLDKVQGANAAGILGTLIGAHSIPAEYRDPLHNPYWNQTLAGLPDSYEIDVLAEDTAQIGMKVLLANGGEVKTRDGSMVLEVPYPEPVAAAKLEQVQWKDDQPLLP